MCIYSAVWEETKAKGVMDADFKLLLYAVDAVKERLSKLKLVVRYKAFQDVAFWNKTCGFQADSFPSASCVR
nr:hypothetical protein [Tanacetum cinerariifolium]